MEQFLQSVYVIMDNPVSLFALMFGAAVVNTFFPPVPIEFATAFAGYLAATGHGSLTVIIAATTAGMFLGNVAVYALARRYGASLFERHIFSRLFNKESYGRTVQLFHAYGVWALFLSKLVPGLNFAAVVTAGLLRMGKVRAVAGILASNLVTFAALAWLGYAAREQWRAAYLRLGKASWALLLGLVFLLLIVLLVTRLQKKKPR